MFQATTPIERGPEGRGLILMYHRVSDLDSDPWGLCVTPQHFAEQLDVLSKLTEPTRLDRFPSAIGNGVSNKRPVAITFDDGYADNLHNAKPLLQQYGMPATLFITTGHIGQRREFWWDELDRLLLQPGKLPPTLEVDMDGTVHNWELGSDADYGREAFFANRKWSILEDPPTARHSVYRSLWNLLQPLDDEKRQTKLNQLRVWAGVESEGRPTHRTLSVEEVTELAEEELIEIGCHTVTHPVLSALPEIVQDMEIKQSKEYLEQITDTPVKSFAYPYGSLSNYSDHTVEIVRNAGFKRACSTITDLVNHDTDNFQLPRVQVYDWNGEDFARWLTGWDDVSRSAA